MTSNVPQVLVYLLRRDLRVADNPILHEISQLWKSKKASFTHLLPIYVFSAQQIEVSGFLKPEFEGKSPYPEARSQVGNFWRCGPHRGKLLAESVWDVKTSLNKLESSLSIRVGHMAEVVEQVLEFYHDHPEKGQVSGVWMTHEVSTEELAEESSIKHVLQARDKQFRLFKDEKYFIDDDDLPFTKAKDLPDVFTTFRKSIEPLRKRPRQPLAVPDSFPPYPDPSSIPPIRNEFQEPDNEPSLVQAVLSPIQDLLGPFPKPVEPTDDINTYSGHPFSGGETQAHKRLNHLFESGAMARYKETRNGLVGADYSTKLSAYLAIGCITARQIHDRASLYEDGEIAARTEQDKALAKSWRKAPGFGKGENSGTAGVRFELLWRDYMRLACRKFGVRLFHRHGFRAVGDKKWLSVDSKEADAILKLNSLLGRFLAGHTGIGLIDASQRELFWTGYTSNRARQNVASFLAKHLNVDWRLGAEWYECMLVDHDVCSNWGNWQYVSGVGNDPREGRIFNPVKQALDYDGKGDYIMTWIPELRHMDVKDVNGAISKDKLMGLFQPWRIPEAERKKLGLAYVQWVDDPLRRISFSVDRKPRGNSGGHRGLQGHGKSSGRGRGGRDWRRQGQEDKAHYDLD